MAAAAEPGSYLGVDLAQATGFWFIVKEERDWRPISTLATSASRIPIRASIF